MMTINQENPLLAQCYCTHMYVAGMQIAIPRVFTSLHGGIKDKNVYSKYYVALYHIN